MKAIFDFLKRITGEKSYQGRIDAIDKFPNVATAYDDVSTLGLAVDSERFISTRGLNLIVDFEDLKLKAYDDGTGVWTIGFGTTVYPNKVRVKKGDRCTVEQAKSFFQHDLRRFQTAVNEAVTVPMSQNQFDALVSLAYNIGVHAFKCSTLVKYLNSLNYSAAADQFLVWNRAGGKILKGLVRRREAERALFLQD